jgi:hypothetical protein
VEHVRLPPLSSGGALVAQPWLRFHTPLIEPDMQISCIRLSDKTSRLRPRHVVPKPAQTYEPEVPVEVREWIRRSTATPRSCYSRQVAARTAQTCGSGFTLKEAEAGRLRRTHRRDDAGSTRQRRLAL